MTNAHATRETADHAELAALIQDLRNSRTVWDNARARPKEIETQAADALENLLSEIAALRGDLTETRVAADLLVSSVHADLRQAERQRDELRKALDLLMRGYVNLLEIGRDRIVMLGGECDPVDRMENDDPVLVAARQALAKQGADQSKTPAAS